LTAFIENYSIPKKCFFSHKLACVGPKFGKNQGLWRHFGDTMSPGLRGIFRLLKEATFQRNLAIYKL